MDNQEVIKAFHLMWWFFPEPVRLIERNRTVLAINKAAEKVECSLGLNVLQCHHWNHIKDVKQTPLFLLKSISVVNGKEN